MLPSEPAQRARHRNVPKRVYSASVLLSKSILVWRNDLYFMDGSRMKENLLKDTESKFLRKYCRQVIIDQ